MSKLETLIKDRKQLYDKIEYYKNIQTGNVIENIKSDINRLNKEELFLSEEICDIQEKLSNNIKLNNQDYKDFIKDQKDYNDTDSELKKKEEELKHYQDLGISDFASIKIKITDLNKKIDESNKKISDEREAERLSSANNSTEGAGDYEVGYEKVWIDENLGIYIMIDKIGVISAVMKEMFKGGGITQESLKPASNPEFGGLPGILEVLIEIIIKSVGTFAKQFFFFKNTIDLLVGFQLGELLGNAIPGIVKVLEELKLLFADPPAFMMKQLLGPLFDANIPIPKFCLNIGDYIPFLPFNLCIPEIDPFGYLTKMTPMNINANQRDLPLDWLSQIQKEIIEEKSKAEGETLDIRDNKLSVYDDEIKDLENDLSGINKYDIMIVQCEINLKKLKFKEEECEERVCDKDHLKKICDDIISQEKCLSDLIASKLKEDDRLKKVDDNTTITQNKITDLKKHKDLLKKTKLTSSIEYKKRAIVIAYEQHIDTKDLDIKLSRIHELGVNIFDPNNLDILQKLGYSFVNDKFISRLEEVMNYGISLSNTKQLRILFELGFNFNDTKHIIKIENLRKFVSLNSVNLTMLVVMGLNIHNTDVFLILKTLKNMKIDILNVDILSRLDIIGFNFNNPNSILRLTTLTKYLDLSDIDAFNTAIKRNINLNNPYFEDILRKTNLIGLRWGEDNYFDVENEILTDTNIPENVDDMIAILTKFRTDTDNTYRYNLYEGTDYGISDVNGKLFEKRRDENTDKNYSNIIKNQNINYIQHNNINYNGCIYLYEQYKNVKTTHNIKTDSDYSYASNRLYVGYNKLNTGIIDESYSNIDGKQEYHSTLSGITVITQTGKIDVPYGQKLEVFWYASDTNKKSFYIDGIHYYSTYGLTGLSNMYIESNIDLINKIQNYKMESTTLSHFYNFMDIYSKYGITLRDIVNLQVNKPINDNYISNDLQINTGFKEEYLTNFSNIFPYHGKNYTYESKNTRKIKMIDTFIKKLLLLKEFHVNQGWVVNQNGTNVHVNESLGGYSIDNDFNDQDYGLNNVNNNDYQNLAGTDLEVVLESPVTNQITFDVLKGVYGNFNKLGLNIRDKNFNTKFKSLFENLKLKVDESVIVDTDRTVFLKHRNFSDFNWDTLQYNFKTEDITTNKADPKYFASSRYETEISVVEKRKTGSKQSIKTVAQFDILQQLGFNFQIENYDANGEKIFNFAQNYANFLSMFSALGLDLKKYESKKNAEILISLGWHWSNDRNFIKLKKMIDIGFDFKIIENSIESQEKLDELTKNMKPDPLGKVEPTEQYKNIIKKVDENNRPQMYSKLDSLNTIGFNFSHPQAESIIINLKNVGLLLSNNNFSSVIDKLLSFGISFNDEDWLDKFDIFKSTKHTITFEDDGDWNKQLDNLLLLGIDFNGVDWKKNYSKMLMFRDYGLDFTLPEINKKVSILINLGLDFTKPEDDWKEKINSLVQLKLIFIGEDSKEKKVNYIFERNKKINHLNDEIIKYERLNRNPAALIDDKINNIKVKLKVMILNEPDNDEVCNLQDMLKELLKNKNNILKLNPNYDSEIDDLKKNRDGLLNISYKYNYNITFASLDKFKGLEKSGVNFYDNNYQKHVKKLLDNGFDFSKPNWEDLLKLLIGVIPGNPILSWTKAIIAAIKTVIMMPMMMLMGIIKKLMDMITAVIGIPLNPLDIPNWIKGILTKFADLIKLIMSLPTLKGMMDFLFMDVAGLTLVDLFVPGFAAFVTMLFDKVASWKDTLIEQKKKLSDKKTALSKLKEQQEIIKSKMVLYVDALADALNPISNNISRDSMIEKIKLKIKILENNNESLKKLVETSADEKTLNNKQLDKIEKEMQKNCDLIDSYNKTVDELKYNVNLSGDEIESKINDLSKKLNQDKEKELNKEISSIKKSNDEIKGKINILGDFCSWGENLDDLILKILRDLISDLKNKTNPHDVSLKNNKEQIEKLESSLKDINDKKNTLVKKLSGQDSSSPQQVKNNKRISDLYKKIKLLEEKICSGDYTQAQIDDLQSMINKYNNEINELLVSGDSNTNTLISYDSIFKKLEDKIKKLKKEQTSLKKNSKSFLDGINLDLLQLDGVAKWLPTILNIVCAIPKMVVNIFIGIINGVGHMEYLPTLWEFPFV